MGSKEQELGAAFESEMKQETTLESKQGYSKVKKGLAYSCRHRLKVGS